MCNYTISNELYIFNVNILKRFHFNGLTIHNFLIQVNYEIILGNTYFSHYPIKL